MAISLSNYFKAHLNRAIFRLGFFRSFAWDGGGARREVERPFVQLRSWMVCN